MSQNAEATTEAPDTEAVAVEQETAGSSEAVQKALEAVNQIVGKVTGALTKGAANDAAPAAAAPAEGEETATAKAAAAKTVGDLLKAALGGSGLEGEALTKASDAAAKALGLKPTQNFPSAKPPLSKTKKSVEEEAEAAPAEPAVEVDAVEKQTLELADMVQKAARFTPARVAKLNEALGILKLVIEGIAPNQSPATRTPGNASFGASGVDVLTKPSTEPTIKKSADGGEIAQLVEAVKGLTGAMGKQDERLEAIEKGRPASNSVAEEGGTDATVKKSKGLWSGTL